MTTRMATALCKGQDGSKTALQAVERAGAKLGGAPHLAIVFASTAYDLPAVVQSVRRATNRVPLVGCSSVSEYTEEEVAEGSIAVALLRSDTHLFATSHAENLRADTNACIEEAVRSLPPERADYPQRSVLLYSDGLAGVGEETVLAATTHLGLSCRFSGGSASDAWKFQKTSTFCDDGVYQDGVSMCLLSSKAPLSNAVRHGEVPFSDFMTFTRTKGNVLYEIDGKPAWRVWKDATRQAAREQGLDVDALRDPGAIGQFMAQFLVGLETDGDYRIRYGAQVDLSNDSIGFVCSVFEGTKFRIMRTVKDHLMASSAQAAREALQGIGGRQPAGAIVVDCAVRQFIFGKEYQRCVEAMKKELGPLPMIGYGAYGEICRQEGALSGFHNTTTVATVIPD
jgi:methyl-accepting chemotaxis protein